MRTNNEQQYQDLLPVYGSYYDSLTQSALVNTPTPIFVRNTALQNQITLQNNSEMVATLDGVYNIQFSLQLYRTAGGTTEQFYLWYQKNNVSVPNSASRITFSNNGQYIVPAWNFVEKLSEGESIRLMWQVSDVNIQITQLPTAGAIPAIPSAIITIVRV